MPSSHDPDPIEWFRYPFIATHDLARSWLQTEGLLGLAPNTLDAYARGLNDFLGFCQRAAISPLTATRGDLARYVGDLRQRPRSHPHQTTSELVPTVGLSNATLQQRLTAVRLFFDFLIEEGQRADHPVGRGRYTPGKAFSADRERALVPRFQTMPWIPSDEQWRAFLTAVKQAPLRTRCMAALAYDTGLRREELCSLQSTDLDPAHRMVNVRAEIAKGSRGRVVPYSATTGELLRAYLVHRRTLQRAVVHSFFLSRQGIMPNPLPCGRGQRSCGNWLYRRSFLNSQPIPFGISVSRTSLVPAGRFIRLHSLQGIEIPKRHFCISISLVTISLNNSHAQ